MASFPGVAWANDRCSQGETRCGDRCVNLKTNERHCGSCRNRCGTKQTCCGGRCVNLKRSERHCGSCSKSCAEGEECVDGVCGGGEPICNPPCPFPCTCFDRGDGPGTVCADCSTHSCPDVSSCAECTDRGLVCMGQSAPFTCGNPCQTMCIPDGGSCISGSDCCSGLVCKGPSGQGTCVASCIPPNAIPCDPSEVASCAGGAGGGCFCGQEASGGGYCSIGGSGIPCSTSCDCPAGQYCSAGAPTGLCAVAATVCPVG